jgi:cell division protein FtsB
MTRNRIIFYSIFGAYQLIAFIFSLIVDYSNSTTFLFGLLKYIAWFKYLTFLGLALIVTDFIWLWMDVRKQRKADESYRHENNVLKAKVYDLQEGAKSQPEVPKAK